MILVADEQSKKLIDRVKKQYRQDIETLRLYQRTTNFLAAVQIYLQDNVLLKEPLKIKHFKPRLLGHWGTCPGINLIYAHLNRLIKQYDLNMFLITGPGHGAPANLANLYLEGSLLEYYPAMTLDQEGLHKFVHAFSWPGGFPSHLYPGVPGTIHEGGELGYALATAFGAVMDQPDIIVACIVGDGEAETGPTAAAWHSHKFLDPVESGAVLPILHLNGYKIASATIFGSMSNTELQQLFLGYGYRPCIVEPPHLNEGMLAAMEWAYQEIKLIQNAARSGDRIPKPKWPLILLRSPKGYTGIKELDGKPIEGSYRSHQVPAKDLFSNSEHFSKVEQWLRSYHPEELFDKNGSPIPEILSACPKGDRRMGMNPCTIAGNVEETLELPNIADFEVQLHWKGKNILRGTTKCGNMSAVAPYLSDVIVKNSSNFRIFCPDELLSNKLDVFDVTQRCYEWPVSPEDEYIGIEGGRVLEILSEHTLQGWMQGYVLTGRHGLFPSYEAFLGIIATMMDQWAKFIKMSKEVSWRKPVPSLNYLSSSTHWRQEHNGFSHQNPSFLNILLNKKGETVRIYLPPDANCLISTMDHCLQGHDYVNLIIATKQEVPQWLTMDEAIAHCRAGASIWKWASTEDGIDPDVVLVGIGDDVTVEVMAAAQIIRKSLPDLRLRVVNVTDLLTLEKNSKHPHGMSEETFNILFTENRPVIINFHGYPTALQQLLFARGSPHRFFIHGYEEEGTTTTPFDMTIRNESSRFHLAIEAIKHAAKINPRVAVSALELITYFEYRLRDHRKYIETYGKDPDDIVNWKWS